MTSENVVHPVTRLWRATVGLVRDANTIGRRNLIKIKRVPDLMVFTTLQPIMFILLFGYIFGSIQGPDLALGYREFLMAGIFTQTIIFGATITGSSMAEDMQKGVIDRFRTLPIHPGAVLMGRTFSDVVNNVLVLIVMTVTGLAIGWRIREGFVKALIAYALMLAFAYAVSWVMAYVGLKVKTPEIVNNASFMIIFPLTFIANTFARAEHLPSLLKTIAGWNPVSAITHAARDNFGNLFAMATPATESAPALDSAAALDEMEYTWALQNAELYTAMWIVGLLVVFIPLSIRAYKNSVTRG